MQKVDQDFSDPLSFQRQGMLGGETLTVLNRLGGVKLSLKTSISNALRNTSFLPSIQQI